MDEIIQAWVLEVTGRRVTDLDCTILHALLREYGFRIAPTVELQARTAEQIRAIMLDDEQILAGMGYVRRDDD